MKRIFTTIVTLMFIQAGPAIAAALDFSDIGMPAIDTIHESIDHIKVSHEDSNPLNRPRTVDVTKYLLDLSVDPFTSRIDGSVTVSFKSLKNNIESVTLDAVEMEIRSIQSGKLRLKYMYDREFLTVLLPKKLKLGEAHEIKIVYSARQPQSLRVTGPDASNPSRMIAAYTYTQPLGTRTWFPVIDRPDDKAISEIKVTVADRFSVLSNGALIGTDDQTDSKSWHYRMDQPIAPYLISLAIGEYEIHELGKFENKAMTLWTPPGTYKRALGEVSRTGKMMESFTSFTATSYPFASYAQSVAEAWGSSMEHQSATTMGGWRMTGDGSGEWVVAHELAHQWFGDWLTCSTWEDLWLNEGFATYLPMVFSVDQNELMDANSQIKRWRNGYFSEAKTMVRALSPSAIDPNDIFDSHSYEKGGLVIHLMRHVMATTTSSTKNEAEPFSRALKHYMSVHGGGNVRHFDLQRAMEKISGNSWQKFFDQWVRSPGHPVLNTEVSLTQSGELILEIEQSQATRNDKKWRLFSFPLQVELFKKNGSSETIELDIFEEKHTFSWKKSDGFVAASLNPNWLVPAEIKTKSSLDAAHHIMKNSKSDFARMDALRIVTRINGSSKIPSHILATLDKDPSKLVVMDAIEHLSLDEANKTSVYNLMASLIFRNPKDRLTNEAIVRTEAWLRRLDKTPATKIELSQWQHRYVNSRYSDQRKTLLSLMLEHNPEATHTFALEQLNDVRWATRDRRYLLDAMTKSPSNDRFIANMLKDGSAYWRRNTYNNLAKDLKIGSDPIFEIAKVSAVSARDHYVRSAAIRFLGSRENHRTKVCPILSEVASLQSQQMAKLSKSNAEALTSATAKARLDLSCADL